MPKIERPPSGDCAPAKRQVWTDCTVPERVTAKARRILKRKRSNAYMQRVMVEHAHSFGHVVSVNPEWNAWEKHQSRYWSQEYRSIRNALDILHAAGKMAKCGVWARLRHYLVPDRVRLVKSVFCKKRALCSFCDSARAVRYIQRILPQTLLMHRYGSRSYMYTLTVKNGPDLAALVDLITDALRKMWARKKARASGPLRHVEGMVVSLEVTGGPGDWHPHLHILATMPKQHRVHHQELKDEWQRLTGGEPQCQQLKYLADPARDIVEVFKYMLKPGELFEIAGNAPKTSEKGLSSHSRVEAWLRMRGRRTVFAYGAYCGFLDDEFTEVELSGESVDWFLRWVERDTSYLLSQDWESSVNVSEIR